MANAATEAPAAYVLATQFHELVQEIIEGMDPEHDHLAIELLKYAERIVGNVGAAEAPYAAEHRQRHYQIAFAAACGCASACDIVRRLRLGPEDQAMRATRTLSTLATMIRPIAEEGMEPRGDMEKQILDDIFESLAGDEPWKDGDDEDERW